MTALANLMDWHRYNKQAPESRRLAFYSEGRANWPHLAPLVRELADRGRCPLSYVSSSPDDPGLSCLRGRGGVFCIGSGLVRTLWFLTLRADLLVMSMPDIETFHIKRSRLSQVQYLYVHHSPVSCHMIYGASAFDHFDEVFCVGPHHEQELRARERIAGLPPKRLFRHGYGRVDDLLEEAGRHPGPSVRGADRRRHVVLAPSWGKDCILETCGRRLVRIVLEAGFKITVRPHPETAKRSPTVIAALKNEFGAHADFTLEQDVSGWGSLWDADVLISDWSGVAYEYAFVRERPVLFIDVPRKINNPGWRDVGIEPMESLVRSEVGVVLSADRLDAVADTIAGMCREQEDYRERCVQARSRWIFHVGRSAEVGADRIEQLIAGSMPGGDT